MSPPRQPVSLATNPFRALTPIMAPRPNSGLETHEEEIIGDSPTLEPYLHHTSNRTAENDYDEGLGKEEESQEKISIIVGIVVALLLAILIVIVCAAVIRRMRRRRLPASAEDGKGIRMKRVKRGKGMDEDFEDGQPSPLDDLHDPYVQFVFIPPNRGLKLWKGRLKIMTRHIKRSLLHKQIEIHGCTIPEHCRAQLKRIYVY